VYPMKSDESAELITATTLKVAPELEHLYAHLLENGSIVPLREFNEEQLHVYPGDVLAEIQGGNPGWETMVPPPVVELIKKRKLFGYAG